MDKSKLLLLLGEDNSGNNIGPRGERLFELLHHEIRDKHPEDGVVVINTRTEEWRYVTTLAEAEKVAKGMKHPEATYYRPCYDPASL